MRDEIVFAQPFDAENGRLTGEAVPIVTGVQMFFGPRGAFSVSDSGVLVYRGRENVIPHDVAWFDRSGQGLRTVGGPGRCWYMELSPDGTQLAL